MTGHDYGQLLRDVVAALVSADPMGLADPAIDLAEEYDSEAREITRRLVHAGVIEDREAAAGAVAGTLSDAFDTIPTRHLIDRIVDGIALGEDGVAVRDGLGACWLELGHPAFRDAAVRIPVSVPIDSPGGGAAPVEHLACALVVEGATAVEVDDPGSGPSRQRFDGLWPEPGPTPTVRIEGQGGTTVRIRGAIGGLRMRIEPLAPGTSAAAPGPDERDSGEDGDR